MSSSAATESLQFTVRDLLVDADRTARQLLSRPVTCDGTSLLAGWDAVLTAGADVAEALQARTPYEPDDAGTPRETVVGRLVDQLRAETRAMGVDQVTSRMHPDLDRLVQTWHQAAGLREQEQRRPSQPAGEALLRVTRTLATVAHATHLAVAGQGPGVSTLGRDEADGLQRLLQRHEQLTLRTVRVLAHGGDVAGASPAPAPVPSASDALGPRSEQLTEQLAGQLRSWGRLATEVAANPETPQRDLRRIAQTEALMTAGIPDLLAAAARHGEIPAGAIPHLRQRMTAPRQQWTRVAGQWGWLRRRGTSAPAASSAKQHVLRTSHELGQVMSAAVQAQRPGPGDGSSTATGEGGRLVPVLEQITENSAILAEIYARLPARALRRDPTGQLRPTLFAPHGIQHGISETSRDPQLVDTDLELAIPGRQRTDLRAITPETAAFLLDSGADLALAAAAAGQALNVAVTASQPVAHSLPAALTSPTAVANPFPLPRRPAPPHHPGSSTPSHGLNR